MILVEHNWLLYIAAFACAFAITLVTTPFAKWLSVKCGAIDYPKDRGVHKKPMPRMGGVAIVLGFTITVLMVNYFDKSMDSRQFAGFLVGALLIAGLGVVDDMKNLPAKLKFCVQILAALIVIFSGTRIQVVLWPVTAYLQKFSIPITLVWIVGVTNAVNLIDGLDGLAAGVTSIAAMSLMVLCIMTGSTTAVGLTAALAGACLGFLPRNFNPAEIFMGDTGSMLLGYTLAAISVMGAVKTAAAIALVVPAIVLGLPILDTLFAIVRRRISGRPIFKPDKGHVHHRLLAQGLTQKQAVLMMYAVTALFGGVSVIVAEVNAWIGIALVLVIFLGSIFVARRLGVITHSDAAGHPLPRPTIERSDSDETISFDREELAKALEESEGSHKE